MHMKQKIQGHSCANKFYDATERQPWGDSACSVHACTGRRGKDYLVHTYFYSKNAVRHFL